MLNRLLIPALAFVTGGLLLAAPLQPTTPAVSPPPELAELLKLGQPSEHHRMLDAFAGRWTESVRCWVAPDAKPVESTMTVEYGWVLDGRFLQGRHSGALFGQPFSALEFRGYDNASGQFTFLWMDSLATATMSAAGQFDQQGRIFTMSGGGIGAGTGAGTGGGTGGGPPAVKYRVVTHLVGTDRMIFEIFSMLPDGREFRALQVIAGREAS
jgi:hypothetical protein